MDINELLPYISMLSDGPTVLPKVRATVKFVLSRFRLPVLQPDTAFQALDERVYHRLGVDTRDLKKALPVLCRLRNVSRSTWTIAQNQNICSRSLFGSFSCACGGLKGTMMRHISPRSVLLRQEGLELKALQTKTERARRGTRIVICRASLTGVDWIFKGFHMWRRQAPEW